MRKLEILAHLAGLPLFCSAHSDSCHIVLSSTHAAAVALVKQLAGEYFFKESLGVVCLEVAAGSYETVTITEHVINGYVSIS